MVFLGDILLEWIIPSAAVEWKAEDLSFLELKTSRSGLCSQPREESEEAERGVTFTSYCIILIHRRYTRTHLVGGRAIS